MRKLNVGSKVPFAYTDSFFVQTVSEGIEYKYLCYIDESQLGAISLLETKNTTKGNGTEIIIPVKNRYDKEKFQKSIYQQLSYFKNIKYIGFNAPAGVVLFENEHCIVMDRPPYTDMHIVLGQVAYPIDFQTAGFDRWSDGVQNCNVGLKFKIGDLQPTLSRESLFWNDTVKKKVHAKVALARKSIREEIEKDLAAQKDYAKWYSSVILQKSKKFPSQWGFSKVKTEAKYVPADGSTPLEVGHTLGGWFAGCSIKLITPYHGSRRSSKVSSSKTPDYSINHVNVDNILNLPIYKIDGNLSSRKCLYLFSQNKGDFIVVQDTGLDHLIEAEQKRLKPYYKQSKLWRDALANYDDLIVPDGQFVTTSDEDYKEAYKKLVAQRKLEGKFTAKQVVVTDAYSQTNFEKYFTFKKMESKFEDHKTGTIIYGTQEKEKELFKAAAILTFTKKYRGDHNGFTNILFLKVGQQYLKQFSMMTNAYEVKEVLNMKTDINGALADIATAHRYEETIDQYKVLRNFDEINAEMQRKFVELHAFVLEHTQNKAWHTTGLLPEVLALCEKAKVTNKAMDKHYVDIQAYVKGAELLNFIEFRKDAIPAIKDYLTLKKKPIDNKVVMIKEISSKPSVRKIEKIACISE